MPLSEDDFLVIGAFCHTGSFFPISPPRSTFPTSNSFLSLQARIVGGLFLSSQCYDRLFSHLLEINNRLKPPWILTYITHSPVSIFFAHSPNFYRQKSVSIMGDNLRKSDPDLNLGIASIALPLRNVSRASSINRFTLGTTPDWRSRQQNISDLIGQMPLVWGLTDVWVGQFPSPRTVQLTVRNEEPNNLDLHRGPSAFNDWMLTIHWWYLTITEEERQIIPSSAWISGIPTLYLLNAMARFGGFRLGPVNELDFEETVVNNTSFVRVQMDWNCDNPFRLRKNFQFSGRENTIIRFHFARLRNLFSKWGSLKLDIKECPLIPVMYTDQRQVSYSHCFVHDYMRRRPSGMILHQRESFTELLEIWDGLVEEIYKDKVFQNDLGTEVLVPSYLHFRISFGHIGFHATFCEKKVQPQVAAYKS